MKTKITMDNFFKLKRCMYEFTGLEYYLLPICDMYGRGFNLIVEFNNLKREIKHLVNIGTLPTYPLVNLGTKQFVPYIYNSLNL